MKRSFDNRFLEVLWKDTRTVRRIASGNGRLSSAARVALIIDKALRRKAAGDAKKEDIIFRTAENGKKYAINTKTKEIASGVMKGIRVAGRYNSLKMNLQLFSERDIKKQKTSSIKKGIDALQRTLELHKDKVRQPEKYVKQWNEYSEKHKKGLIKHWNHEIENFRRGINDREEELKKRGENHG